MSNHEGEPVAAASVVPCDHRWELEVDGGTVIGYRCARCQHLLRAPGVAASVVSPPDLSGVAGVIVAGNLYWIARDGRGDIIGGYLTEEEALAASVVSPPDPDLETSDLEELKYIREKMWNKVRHPIDMAERECYASAMRVDSLIRKLERRAALARPAPLTAPRFQGLIARVYDMLSSTPDEIARKFGETRVRDDHDRVNYALELLEAGLPDDDEPAPLTAPPEQGKGRPVGEPPPPPNERIRKP